MNKTVLLTGATGFIGRQAIPLLLEKGYKIHAVSTQVPLPQDSRITVHPCNLFNADETKSLLDAIKPIYLLHFAWITTAGIYVASHENLTWMEASLRLARLFVENGGKRMVVAGSCAEYESTPLCTESDNSFNATTFYGQCKRGLYLALANFAKQANFELAWGYLFYLYGPHERPNRFLPSVIRGILQKKEIPLTEGLQIRDFLHTRDAAKGFVELLNSTAEGCFNIASGRGISIRSMVEKVAEKMGGKELLKFGVRPLALFDPPELVASMNKLQNTISWRPSLELDQGLDKIIEWWQCQT